MPASHVACATKRCTPLKRVISPTADAKMQEAAHYSREAHLVQTQLIEADEGEGKPK
ncbi:PTS system cellobiose-specific transporter subunit IIA [Klebsiella pneumoniae]|uniref:PTS system cellobiose-specific transporter subunit IIA n=1 Tax=Klebsiella pneumoniae TaxID=573 RepID=A0A377XQW7_KLEPN|nr:PTS system cellobiose-specific transporter subunit IIA [Klebsiella pneumoniae]